MNGGLKRLIGRASNNNNLLTTNTDACFTSIHTGGRLDALWKQHCCSIQLHNNITLLWFISIESRLAKMKYTNTQRLFIYIIGGWTFNCQSETFVWFISACCFNLSLKTSCPRVELSTGRGSITEHCNWSWNSSWSSSWSSREWLDWETSKWSELVCLEREEREKEAAATWTNWIVGLPFQLAACLA